MKKCPYCGEEIQDIAKKCKHCGEFLDEELREQKGETNSGKIDYSGCKELKRGMFQGIPKIECPKCGYKGKSKRTGGYSDITFLLLLVFGIIPGLIYYAVCGHGKYICPQCGEVHLKKIGNGKSGTIIFGIICIVFILLMFASNKDYNPETKYRENGGKEVKTNPVQERINTLTNMYTDKNSEMYRKEFQSMKCNDENCKEVYLYITKDVDPGKDLITRGQAVNLSKVANGGVQVFLFIDNKLAYHCVAYNGSIAEDFGNNGCN